MKQELRARIIAFNRSVKENRDKASDLQILVSKIAELPPGQIRKVLTEEILVILQKYGAAI